MSSDSIAALAKAMIKAQASIAPASKDRMNPFTRSMYATLGSVMESCRQALLNAGVWVTQYPVPVEGSETLSSIGLVTKLVHAESGEWQSSLLIMPVVKNDPQGFGSALTYARRYALSAMVGIVTEDDDANEACQAPTKGATAVTPATGSISTASPVVVPEQRENTRVAPPAASKDVSSLDGLPRIDGVTFSQVAGQDGIAYITASGETRSKSSILKEAGFKWDAVQRLWWKSRQPIPA